MNCPNCGGENINGNICSDCSVNINLYNKIISISNTLYNSGLAKAKSKDLSSAIDCLTKSLRYNKKNIEARNLLGLILFEIGHLGEAYKHFVLSLVYQKDDNKAQKYIDIINKDSHKIDALKDSVRIYNQGLTYLCQKSDDMAIIQLKKAIDINPAFIDAMNLLAATYIYQKENLKALQILDKVLAIDILNPKAQNYRGQIIHTIPNRRSETSEQKVTKQKNIRFVDDSKKMSGFGGSAMFNVLYILIGAVISFLIFFVLIIPGMTKSNAGIINDLTVKNETLETTLNQLKESNEKTILELQTASKELESQKKSLEEKVNIQNKREVLNEAQNLINNAQYEEAANVLYNLDPTGLPVDLSDTRSQLVAETFPRACNSLYNRAASRYRSRDYDSAEALFLDCIKYADIDSNFAGDSYYYLAEIYYIKEDKEKSKQLFEKVVAEYPASNFYWVATNRLDSRF